MCSFIAQQHISGKKTDFEEGEDGVQSLHEMRIGGTLHVPAQSRTMVAHGIGQATSSIIKDFLNMSTSNDEGVIISCDSTDMPVHLYR
jgi:hypothetical protein